MYVRTKSRFEAIQTNFLTDYGQHVYYYYLKVLVVDAD